MTAENKHHAEESSPYDAHGQHGNVQANDSVESLKAAGKSAFELAKDFTERFREDRANKSSATDAQGFAAGQTAGQTADAQKDSASFFDKATDLAMDLGGSVRRAAEGSRESAEFANAKESLGAAFAVAKEEASEAVKTIKGRVDEYKGKSTTEADEPPVQRGDDVADPNSAVVDGEVVEDDASPYRQQ